MIKQLKNRKGFTLVEIIAVVVIIGLLAGIGIPLVTKYVQDGRNKYNKELENEFLTIVKDYYAENPELVPKGRGEKGYSNAIFLTKLQSNNYLSEELKDANGGSCYDSVGYAIFKEGKVNYYACLKCDNYTGVMNQDDVIGCDNFGGYKECENREGVELSVKNVIFEGIKNAAGWYKNDVKVQFDLIEEVLEITSETSLEQIESAKKRAKEIPTQLNLKVGRYTFNNPLKNVKNIVQNGTNIERTISYTFIINKNVNGYISIYDRCGNSKDYEGNDDYLIKIDKDKPKVELTGDKEYVLEPGASFVTVAHEVTIKDFSTTNEEYEYCDSSNNCVEPTSISGSTITYNAEESGQYTFKVISTDAAGNSTTQSHSFVVKNKIKFTLNGGGGSFKDILKEKGIDVDIPPTKPTKVGYNFLNWEATNGVSYKVGSSYKENLSTILTAQWDAKTVEVIFVCPDGDVRKQSFTYDKVNQKFNVGVCSKPGYDQIGWSKSQNATSASWDIYSGVVNSWIHENSPSITLYPVWKAKTVEVSFVCSANDIKKQIFTYGVSNQKFTSKCNRYGYEQIGWSHTANATSQTYATNNSVADTWIHENSPSITLYPVWKAKTVAVTFACSEGNKYKTYTYGVSGQQFTDLCYKTGHTQIGWSHNANATSQTYATNNSVADTWIHENSPSITLYPVWQKLSTTVYFVCPNGTQTRTYIYGNQNQAFDVRCSTTGYDQVGWSYSQNGPYAHSTNSGVADSWIISKAGNVWLYPVWTAKTVVVGFDCAANSLDSNVYYQTFTYGVSGQKFGFLCSVPGYRQTGWAESATATKIDYTADSGVADSWINDKSPSIWLYPVWEEIPVPPTPSVTVKFHCLDENYNYTNDMVYSYTYYAGTPNQYFLGGCNPVYGFDNVGWSLEQYGSTRWNLGIAVQDYWIEERKGQTIDVYAAWAPKTVTVTFVCPEGNKYQTFTNGASGQQFNSNCASNGLVQKGWAYSANGAYAHSLNSGVADWWIINNSPSVTLYPVWHYPPVFSNSCSYDRVPPVCVLNTSCNSVAGGVSAGFSCTDATSNFDIYSVFAEQGWQSERFSSIANIKAALNYKNSGTPGTWISPKTSNGTTTWTGSTTPWNPPVWGKTYTFYFGAIDSCGNAVVYDNVTSSCIYNK